MGAVIRSSNSRFRLHNSASMLTSALTSIILTSPIAFIDYPPFNLSSSLSSQNLQKQLRASYRFSSADDEDDDVGFEEEVVALFNERDYYKFHDFLESLWNKSQDQTRTLVHGILQCAVGFHHLFNQNHKGAMMELGEGLCKLRKMNLESGPFYQFEIEISAVLDFIYHTQLELAACIDQRHHTSFLVAMLLGSVYIVWKWMPMKTSYILYSVQKKDRIMPPAIDHEQNFLLFMPPNNNL